MVGGLGICGRPLCCTCFLNEFKPVPINVAKMQSVALNLSKISGTCGRLKCCLNFEAQFYAEELKKYPKLNSHIKNNEGKDGKVVEVNILSRYMIIETLEKEDNEHIKNRVKIPIDEWEKSYTQIRKEKHKMQKVKLHPREIVESLGPYQLKVIQNKDSYCFSIDSLLLAQFIKIKNKERVIDLGTGCGLSS